MEVETPKFLFQLLSKEAPNEFLKNIRVYNEQCSRDEVLQVKFNQEAFLASFLNQIFSSDLPLSLLYNEIFRVVAKEMNQ